MFKLTILTLSCHDSAERQELSCMSVLFVSPLMLCMFCVDQDQNPLLLKDSQSTGAFTGRDACVLSLMWKDRSVVAGRK